MKHRRLFIQRLFLGFSKEKKERLNNLFLCFSLNSISITSHKHINETSTTFHSAIVFGSLKREKREIEFIYSYVFL